MAVDPIVELCQLCDDAGLVWVSADGHRTTTDASSPDAHQAWRCKHSGHWLRQVQAQTIAEWRPGSAAVTDRLRGRSLTLGEGQKENPLTAFLLRDMIAARISQAAKAQALADVLAVRFAVVFHGATAGQCDHCGRPFADTTKRQHKRFCSDYCRKAHHEARQAQP